MARSVDEIVLKYVVENENRMARSLGEVGRAAGTAEKQMDSFIQTQARALKNQQMVRATSASFIKSQGFPRPDVRALMQPGLGGLGAGLGAGAGLGFASMIGKATLGAAGGVESQIEALTALTKSGEKARATFGYLDQQSTESVFSRKDLMGAGQLLTAYQMKVQRFLPLADDLAAAFRNQGATVQDTSRVFGRLASGDFGEAFERLRDFGINRRELEGQGLKFDKGGSYQGSVEDALSAVETLVKQKYNGLSKTLATNTLEGGLSNLEDSFERLKATAGEMVLPDAKRLVSGLADATSQLNEFTKAHPDAIRGVAMLTAGVGGLALAGGGYKALRGGLGGLKEMADDTRGIVGKLGGAWKEESLIEQAKTGIAIEQARALGGLGDEAATTADKVGMLAKMQNLMKSPLSVGGRGFSMVGGMPISNGGAAIAGAAGLVAGVSASNNMQAAGFSDAESYMYGAVTGIGAAGAAAWLPGGAIAVAVGEAAAFGINKLYTEPLERAAQGNITEDEAQRVGKMSNKERAAFYADKAIRAQAAGDEFEAQSFTLQSLSARKRGKHEQDNAWRNDNPAIFDEANEKMRQAAIARGDGNSRSFSSVSADVGNVQRHDNGVQRVTVDLRIPEGPGDKLARERNYVRRTASPNWAY